MIDRAGDLTMLTYSAAVARPTQLNTEAVAAQREVLSNRAQSGCALLPL